MVRVKTLPEKIVFGHQSAICLGAPNLSTCRGEPCQIVISYCQLPYVGAVRSKGLCVWQ